MDLAQLAPVPIEADFGHSAASKRA